MTQQPSVGRIVHYYGKGINYPEDQPIPAIITEVHPHIMDDQWYDMGTPTQDQIVRLRIFWPTVEEPIDKPNWGYLYAYSETPKPGHWNWPPRA